MPSPEKFRDILDAYNIDKAIIDKMYDGFGNLTSKTSKKIKSAFFYQALNVMNENLPSETVKKVFEANACCKSGTRERNSKEFARIHKELEMEERLKLISERPYMNMGSAKLDENGFLIVNAVSYDLNGKYECACPTVSKIKRDYVIPREYCYCCGGHFKYHYEIMLDRKLELIAIVSSPHDTDGKKACVFKYRIETKSSDNH